MKSSDQNPDLSEVKWWEMLDWNEMTRVWATLPDETKEKIRIAGLAPDNE